MEQSIQTGSGPEHGSSMKPGQLIEDASAMVQALRLGRVVSPGAAQGFVVMGRRLTQGRKALKSTLFYGSPV